MIRETYVIWNKFNNEVLVIVKATGEREIKVIGATTNHTKTYWIPTTLEGVERLLRSYPHITELQTLRNKLDDELFMSQFPSCVSFGISTPFNLIEYLVFNYFHCI